MEARLAPLKYRLTKLFKGRQAFVVILIVLLVLLVAFLRINSLSNMPVNQHYIDQKKSEIKAVRFNEDAIKQIESLNESNVKNPGTKLPSNRQNPFNE